MSDLTPLNPQIVRGLNDKLYEKRKVAALEIDRLVRDLHASGENAKIVAIIKSLVDDFASSMNIQSRKGGLIGLAAVAIALGPHIESYIALLVPPVLACLGDNDGKVRYFACESMYNLAKIARGLVLTYFNEIFDYLSKLAADPEPTAKTASELLDRLMKDIITEAGRVDLERFIPLLSERIYVKHPFVREFLVSWISVLDSVPGLNMVNHLPAFLDGLFVFLSDPSKDIHVQTANVLAEFLREIKQQERADFARMTEILVKFINAKDNITQATALTWINDFILLSRETMLPYAADLLAAVLPSLAHKNSNIRNIAQEADVNLMNLLMDTSSTFDYDAIVSVLILQLIDEAEDTRLAALEWLMMLHRKDARRVIKSEDEIFPALLKTLSDASEEVVRLDLRLLAQISSDADSIYFRKFMNNLTSLFSTDRRLLENRGSLIVCQLCLSMGAERIFRSFADVLQGEEDLEFGSLMVQHLNLILLTAPEVVDLRRLLKNLKDSTLGQQFFAALYRSWSHNPVATFSLCLLAQLYQHACDLVQIFSELEMTVAFLVEVDKLVQLLESPIFTYLRLQLLQQEENIHLFKCLYGILMLLPQSSAFATLRNRLNSVSSMGVLHLMPSKKPRDETKLFNEIKFDQLLAHFRAVQEKHDAARRLAILMLSKDPARRARRTIGTPEKTLPALGPVPSPSMQASSATS